MLTAELVCELFVYLDGALYWRASRRGIRRLLAGCANKNGYWEIKVNGAAYKRHRLVFLMFRGYMPEWPNQIDHINRVKGDDRIENLRDVTPSQNMWNTDRKGRKGRGYYWNNDRQKWMAYIRVAGRLIYLGYFSSRAKARAAYLAAKKIYHRTGT
jgi:HNH endonuclease